MYFLLNTINGNNLQPTAVRPKTIANFQRPPDNPGEWPVNISKDTLSMIVILGHKHLAVPHHILQSQRQNLEENAKAIVGLTGLGQCRSHQQSGDFGQEFIVQRLRRISRLVIVRVPEL